MLEPGLWTLTVSCGGTNPYIGCQGTPGVEHLEDEHYNVAIDAVRKAIDPTSMDAKPAVRQLWDLKAAK
jgi:hypothetical protein